MEDKERLKYLRSLESDGEEDSKREIQLLLPMSIILVKGINCKVTKHRLQNQRPVEHPAVWGDRLFFWRTNEQVW